MLKVDLITGFLGAGKTTFIHFYVRWLTKQGYKIAVIENEFCKVDVDSSFLEEDACQVESLAGMCMCCSGKAAFEKMLVRAAEKKYDRILVEPSGIYDVDEFFSAMSCEAVRNCCEIGSILTVLDGNTKEMETREMEYLLFCQLAAAGTVILSRTQWYGEEEIHDTLRYIHEIMQKYGSGRCFEGDVLNKDWETLTDSDFTFLASSGYRREEHRRHWIDHQKVFQTCMVAGICEEQKELEEHLKAVFDRRDWGRVFRIKGYIRDRKNHWYEVNATPDTCSVRVVKRTFGVLVIIGQDLNSALLEQSFRGAPQAFANQ